MTYPEFYRQWTDEHEFVEAHTSGSTGTPKTIRLSKADMQASAMATNQFFGIDHNSILVTPLAADYIAGKMMAVRAHISGAKLITLEASNNFTLPDAKIKLLAIIPSQALCLLENRQWAERIDNVLIGGAEVNSKLKSELLHAGYNCWESYGMTETCSHVALRKLGEEAFSAMPNISFSVDGESCLKIHFTTFSFTDIQTNDIVELIDNKHFIWLGRRDNVINSGGIKIHAEQLEKKIAAMLEQDIRGNYNGLQFVIVATPHDKWGQCVTMLYEGTGAESAELRNILSKELSHKLLPKRFIAVERLPRTENGKIRRIIPLECSPDE